MNVLNETPTFNKKEDIQEYFDKVIEEQIEGIKEQGSYKKHISKIIKKVYEIKKYFEDNTVPVENKIVFANKRYLCIKTIHPISKETYCYGVSIGRIGPKEKMNLAYFETDKDDHDFYWCRNTLKSIGHLIRPHYGDYLDSVKREKYESLSKDINLAFNNNTSNTILEFNEKRDNRNSFIIKDSHKNKNIDGYNFFILSEFKKGDINNVIEYEAHLFELGLKVCTAKSLKELYSKVKSLIETRKDRFDGALKERPHINVKKV